MMYNTVLHRKSVGNLETLLENSYFRTNVLLNLAKEIDKIESSSVQ